MKCFTVDNLRGQNLGFPLLPYVNRCAPFFSAVIAWTMFEGQVKIGKEKASITILLFAERSYQPQQNMPQEKCNCLYILQDTIFQNLP